MNGRNMERQPNKGCRWNRRGMLCALLCLQLLSLLFFTGCAAGQSSEGTKVVLTTGFARDEVFRIETASCTLPEIMVYLTNTQNQYESIYGAQIWQKDLKGVTLEENVKDTVLACIAQVKAMNLLAQNHGVTLDEKEQEQVDQAAKAYYGSLNETEIARMDVTEDTIRMLYTEYALADKVYHYIIKDINPEISDDEARTITVQHILIKTYSVDGSGNRVPYTDEAREEAYAKAQEALKQARAGEDFDQLVSEYNEDTKSLYSFGKGEMGEAFEQAAFDLGNGEISDIVETEYGYHIIQCLNTFNREETDANKVKIVEQRREEVFGQEYDAFVASLTKNLNEELWEKVAFVEDEQVKTSDFFQVYDSYFR